MDPISLLICGCSLLDWRLFKMTFHLQEFAANWEDDENQLIIYLIVFTYFDFFLLMIFLIINWMARGHL